MAYKDPGAKKEYDRAHYAANREKKAEYQAANREKVAEGKRQRHAANPEKRALTGARNRARKLGLPFDLVEADLIAPKLCMYCDQPMSRETGNMNTTPSVDRIKPELGYVKANIAIICGRCNRLKQDSTPEQMHWIADRVSALIKDRGLEGESK